MLSVCESVCEFMCVLACVLRVRAFRHKRAAAFNPTIPTQENTTTQLISPRPTAI